MAKVMTWMFPAGNVRFENLSAPRSLSSAAEESPPPQSGPDRRLIAVPSRRGRLAQLAEHLLYTQGVGGSIPSPPTRRTRMDAAIAERSVARRGGRRGLVRSHWQVQRPPASSAVANLARD